MFAAADGVVKYVANSTSWLGIITIEHSGMMQLPDGTPLTQVWTLYGHLDPNRMLLKEGDPVYRGQVIGVIGDHPDGPHLHFSIRTQVPTSSKPAGYSTSTTGWTDPSNFVDANSPPPGPFDADFNTGDLREAGLGSSRPGSNAQIVTSLGTVNSLDRSSFMVVTTNATADTRSFGGTQGSVVYSKAFVVTANSVLRLEYKFLTSEAPQSPTYNDFAAVYLLDALSGTRLATVKYIDTYSTLNGGSGGGYNRQTGWYQSAFGLGPFVNPRVPVKIQIVVSDRGDTAVDSALAIDNLRVVTTRLSKNFNAGTVRTAGLLARRGSSARVAQAGTPGTPSSANNTNFLLIDNKNATVSTSAFGGTTGSVLISEAFLVPQNGILSFAYNFLTNEATPNSFYQDFAQINLLTATGGMIANLWRIDTNAGGFVSASGSGYAKQTNWKNAGVSLSAYAGQQVKLQFVVSDRGDSSVDSALLIDNLFV